MYNDIIMSQWLTDYGSFIGSTVIIAGAIGWYIKIQMKEIKRDISFRHSSNSDSRFSRFNLSNSN